MLSKFCFVFIIFLLGSVYGVDDPAGTANVGYEGIEHNFYQEAECSQDGGICLPRESCPPEKISTRGYCPKQSTLGAVCCHSLSITETRCVRLGGHCRENCPEHIVIGRANDCPEGQKCCPLV